MIEGQKKTAFIESLRKDLSVFLPNFPEFKIDETVKSVGSKYLVEYIESTNIGDPNNLLSIREKAAVELGSMIQNNVQKKYQSSASGLKEFVVFSFLSHYSKYRAQEYLNKISKQQNMGENFARYYFAIGEFPKNLEELLQNFKACSVERANNIIRTLKGEELERVIELLSSQKWNRRIIERIREYLRIREISYNSLVNKILETNPAPRLFILFKNEGTEPESNEEESGHRPVTTKLRELRFNENVDLISPMTSIYFVKDNSTIEELLNSLPSGIENNYVLFVGELDPLSVNVRTSDRLEGHPEKLYMNLQKFRDLKNVYESIILKLGVKPSEIIETADLSFLIEPKSESISDNLRKNSKDILKKLSKYSGRTYEVLSDLRNLDENDIGFLGSLITKYCKIQPSEARCISEQIFKEAKELHRSLYAEID